MSEASPNIFQIYDAALRARGYASDPAQQKALQVLDRCIQDWQTYQKKRSNLISNLLQRPTPPKGVYMYGGVGRGKSFLMDCFFQALPIKRKTRLHFHEFMREVHRELARLQGTVNPLDYLGRAISKRFAFICFDEFHVSNVPDAMILDRLLTALLKYGVGLVCTSNFAPEGLYPDGLNRDRFLPAIDLIQQAFEVIEVDNGTDYRQNILHSLTLYHTPVNEQAEAAMRQAFTQLAETHAVDETPLHIEAREIPVLRKAGGVVWFDFNTLCAGPRSQNDYLEIATQFHTVLLSQVPQMSVRLANAARRFTWLIDVLYDRGVKLILSADVIPEELYLQGPLVNEFTRTVSRLYEMQSAKYLALQHRTVDTDLT